MSTRAEPLPHNIYTTAQVRELDRIAIEDLGIESFTLMRRAARASFEYLCHRWPGVNSLLIYSGAGNNAGDGYVLADIAAAEGFEVSIRSVVDPAGLTGDAARAYALAADRGVSISPFSDEATGDADVIVDALLGTGLTRDLDGVFASCVETMSACDAPVLALDVPSGLDSDSGHARGSAVKADATVTFVGLKQGLFLGRAPDYCGELSFAGLDVPDAAYARIEPVLERLAEEILLPILAPRLKTSHKSLNGKVLLVGGSPGMSGAIRLAAEAALRTGAGLVHVATHPASVAAVMAGRPEIMCRGVETAEEIGDWTRADAVVLGPGLGQDDWGRELFAALINLDTPTVVDADGLNLLAERPLKRRDWVLTPHPGEAARLLDISTADVQADRLAAIRQLLERYQGHCVLKGACSLVGRNTESDTLELAVCDAGNPGMATAGMGDVLSGVIGSLVAQSRDLSAAVPAAVLIHALAGDAAAHDGERGMLASDLLPFIRRRVNPH